MLEAKIFGTRTEDGKESVPRARRTLIGPQLVGTTRASWSWHVARLTRPHCLADVLVPADLGHALAHISARATPGAPMDEVRLSGGMPRTLYCNNDVPQIACRGACGNISRWTRTAPHCESDAITDRGWRHTHEMDTRRTRTERDRSGRDGATSRLGDGAGRRKFRRGVDRHAEMGRRCHPGELRCARGSHSGTENPIKTDGTCQNVQTQVGKGTSIVSLISPRSRPCPSGAGQQETMGGGPSPTRKALDATRGLLLPEYIRGARSWCFREVLERSPPKMILA
jgi:hypothetical protein